MEVAVLEHHTVPVLALQHLVIPIGGSCCHNAYLIVSGATDGSIAVWDITNLVITFTKQMLSGVVSSAGTQLRPRTGRGSQGGRRFRNAKQQQAGLPKESKNATVVEGAVDIVSPIKDVNVEENAETNEGADANTEARIGTAVQAEDTTGSLPYQSSLLLPLYTFAAAHQSGVNCLSAAKRDSEVVVVSGGDDQRIHVLRFEIHPCEGEKHRKCAPSGGDVASDSQGLQIRLISLLLINSIEECFMT